jgi:hypothetical protein
MACGRCAKRVCAFCTARWARPRVHGAGSVHRPFMGAPTQWRAVGVRRIRGATGDRRSAARGDVLRSPLPPPRPSAWESVPESRASASVGLDNVNVFMCVTEPTQCGGSACGVIDRARQQRRSLGTSMNIRRFPSLIFIVWCASLLSTARVAGAAPFFSGTPEKGPGDSDARGFSLYGRDLTEASRPIGAGRARRRSRRPGFASTRDRRAW